MFHLKLNFLSLYSGGWLEIASFLAIRTTLMGVEIVNFTLILLHSVKFEIQLLNNCLLFYSSCTAVVTQLISLKLFSIDEKKTE